MGFRTHIRPTRPGKFEGNSLDARVCEAVYAAIDGGRESAGGDEMGHTLTVVTSQRRIYLVEEDSQGFAAVAEVTKEKAAEALAEARLQESEFYGDDTDDAADGGSPAEGYAVTVWVLGPGIGSQGVADDLVEVALRDYHPACKVLR